MTNGAAPSSTVPALNLDPPDDGEALSCSCCGREVDGCVAEEIRCGVYGCSPACVETLLAMWCPGCGANVAEGDDCACAEESGVNVSDRVLGDVAGVR